MAMRGGGYGYGVSAYGNYDSYARDFGFGFGGSGARPPPGGGYFGGGGGSGESGGPTARVNPEYYQKEGGYGYEGTRTSAIDETENPAAKRRKVEGVSICFDFVRGHCGRGAKCSKPHVNFVESIDEREIMSKVKFCHDFQNRGMCSRGDCKFLHVTRARKMTFY
ncbi:Zinc finger CCCH domain-containing protein 10 [Geodia barretti]|uniref:Zinc finger CCCH domain-containing protein 10 n=1 Tax=Geodia barretti TaxID=519541 RepID=A0AA35W155_GEOBA|nr:Zinc finger CCCH domain-containing protein 10 [Geodia barretti]